VLVQELELELEQELELELGQELGLVQVLAQELDLGCCMQLSELNMYRVHIYWQRLHKDQCMSLCSPVQHRQVHILI